MIHVKILKDKDSLRGYKISGHSNHRPSGEDIICAGVSILSQTVLESLVKVSKIREEEIKYNIKADTGFLDVLIPNNLDDKVFNDSQVLIESLITGIELMIEAYPEYIKITYEEV